MTAVAPGRASAPAGGRPPGPAGGALAGTGELARLALRRDRVMLPVWVYLLGLTVAETAFGLGKLYPTAARRDALVGSLAGNPALGFLYGKLHGTSLGALTAWRYLVYTSLGAGLMSIFLVIRHTRADEQAGRLELARSAAVGRHAPLTAGLGVGALANAVLVVLIVAAALLVGLPLGGSLAYALAAACCGLVFAAVAGVAAQLTEAPRLARGIAIAVLGAADVLRGVGDSAGARGPEWLSWASPVGWAEAVRPFAGNRWPVLALPLAAAVALGCLAYALAVRRDLGAGLFPPRPGSPAAGAALRGPLGLAWRLQRGSVAGWALGLLGSGIAVGAAGKGIGQLLGTSSAMRQAFERIGGQAAVTDAYLAAIMTLAGLTAAGYAVSAVLRLHGEEESGLAEAVLTASAGRVRWALSHLAVAVAGTAVAAGAAGIGAGLGYGLRAGDVGGQVARLLAAGLAQVPAALAVAGVAMVLYGLLPQAAVTGGYTALGLAALIALLGPSLRLPQWITDLSPFSHVPRLPRLPGTAVTAAPFLWLALAAVAAALLGLIALRRRDLR